MIVKCAVYIDAADCVISNILIDDIKEENQQVCWGGRVGRMRAPAKRLNR